VYGLADSPVAPAAWMLNPRRGQLLRHRRRVRRAPAPASRGAQGRDRAIVNRAFAKTVVFETNGHGPRAGAAGEHVGPVPLCRRTKPPRPPRPARRGL